MGETTHIILNPKGHLHRDGRTWMAHQRDVLRRLAPAEVTPVDSAEEAAAVAREAALAGFGKLIAAGGGEVGHGLVNGVMGLAEGHRRALKIGFLSLTRPDLWSRTLELPTALERQLEILTAGHTLPYDVGRVDCHDEGGRPVTRHFVNGASLGITGLIRREWRDPRTNLLRTLVRIRRAVGAAGHGQGSSVRLEGEDDAVLAERCVLAMVMSGRYYPSLGKVAPQANPTDGRLELTWIEPAGPWDLLRRLAGLYVPLSGGRREWHSVGRVRAVAAEGPVWLEVDGHPVGRLPATFSVERRALPVIVERVAVRLREPQRALARQVDNGRLAGNIRSAAGL